MTLPELQFGQSGQKREDMLRLVGDACAAYAARQLRRAADSLAAAESLATHLQFFNDAAKIRKALTILAQGGKPRLLVRGSSYLDQAR